MLAPEVRWIRESRLPAMPSHSSLEACRMPGVRCDSLSWAPDGRASRCMMNAIRDRDLKRTHQAADYDWNWNGGECGMGWRRNNSAVQMCGVFSTTSWQILSSRASQYAIYYVRILKIACFPPFATYNDALDGRSQSIACAPADAWTMSCLLYSNFCVIDSTDSQTLF
ncbi:hypothetical protein BDW22DRAFT_1349141 [Trametopsis cervina]|nr:hypothetical protein BDW22DRAFT_1349141 [Trametopsis cervina]